MSLLVYSGIPEKDSYDIIKAISKKNIKLINDSKNAFISGLVSRLINESNINEKDANEKADMMWQVIEDSSRYSFNASHAYCVAIDSLYGAYLKANYPHEFYEVCLEFYSDKKDAEKVSKFVSEMKGYKQIKMGELKFGFDNRKYTADIENNIIYPSLKGVKYINDEVKEYLWYLSENFEYNNNYTELYRDLKLKLNKRHIETLIKVSYFKDFGAQLKLIKWALYTNEVLANKQYRTATLEKSPNLQKFLMQYSNKQTEKTIYIDEEASTSIKKKLFEIMPEEDFSIVEKIRHEVELIGEIITEMPDGVTAGEVKAISYKKPVFLFKSWKNGKEVWVNVDSRKQMPKRGDIALLYGLELRPVGRRQDIFAQVEVIKEGK